METLEEVEESAWNTIYPERGREYWSAASLQVPRPKDDKGLSLLSTEGFLSLGTGTKRSHFGSTAFLDDIVYFEIRW